VSIYEYIDVLGMNFIITSCITLQFSVQMSQILYLICPLRKKKLWIVFDTV